MERYTSDTGSSAGKATSQPLQCNAKLVQTRRLHCIVLTPTKQPFDIQTCNIRMAATTMSSVPSNTKLSLGTASRSPFAGGRALPARVCTPATARRASVAVTKALFTRNKSDVSFSHQAPTFTLAQCRLVGPLLRVGSGRAGLCAACGGPGVVGDCCIISRQLYYSRFALFCTVGAQTSGLQSQPAISILPGLLWCVLPASGISTTFGMRQRYQEEV